MFQRFFNIIGGSYKNPIDMGMNWAGENLHEIMRILMEDANIDAVVNDLPLTFLYRRMASSRSRSECGMFARYDHQLPENREHTRPCPRELP
jgi:hypothetical protein